MSEKAEEIESFANRKDMKKFHDALKMCMALKVLEPPHCLVQMEAHFSLIKMLFWQGGQNTSISCSIAHHMSDAINRLPQIECNVLLDELPADMETKEGN